MELRGIADMIEKELKPIAIKPADKADAQFIEFAMSMCEEQVKQLRRVVDATVRQFKR